MSSSGRASPTASAGAAGAARSRLGLLPYFLLLALPLAAGIWAVADYAAANERERADARLGSVLNAAVGAYTRVADEAQGESRRLASSAAVQRALARRDRGALARLERTHPSASFHLSGSGVAEASLRRAIVRTTEVLVGNRRVGWVVVTVPFDAALIRRLGRSARLTGDERLRIVTGEDAGRGRETIGGTEYRSASARLFAGESPARLLALTPASVVEERAADMRLKVLLAGLVTLVSVLLIAYVLGSAIARGRISQQQRALAARVLSHAGDGIFLVGADGRIGFWNEAAETITGLKADGVLGRRATEAVPGWRAVEELVPVAGAHERARPETVPLALADHELWISISAASLPDGVVYSFQDVSEERRLEAARTDFVATVSHELRTPLASIHGAAVTLRRHGDSLPEETREQLLAVAAEESERLARLIEQILLASELSSGGLAVASEAFDAEELARDVVEAAHVRSAGKHGFVLVVEPGLPPASGSADKARQVLANLVENAIKYSPEGGPIEVRVDAPDGRVRFAVHDEGLGVPPREHERIFEKFYRLDPQLRRGIGGSGLGLYISRELVQQMDGRIWLESAPGHGSTFSFELPPAEQAQPEGEPSLAGASSLKADPR